MKDIEHIVSGSFSGGCTKSFCESTLTYHKYRTFKRMFRQGAFSEEDSLATRSGFPAGAPFTSAVQFQTHDDTWIPMIN